MSLQIVKEIYRRFAEGDLEGFLSLCANDIEWVVNGPAELEKCRAFKGIDGVREFLTILDRTWHFTSFNPREFIDGGDRIVVLGEERGTDRHSGESFENRWAHVFTVRDGVVVTFREFLCHWSGNQRPPSMNWGSQDLI
jgi:ketosteroid isomerase-like protein